MDRKHMLLWVTATMVGVAGTVQAQIRIVNTIPGAFMDISGSGASLGLNDEGEASILTTVGNSVYPAGVVVVGNNGGVGFAPPDTELDEVNTTLPSMTAFGGGRATLVYWDDLDYLVDEKDGDVVWSEVTMPGSGDVLIVQWEQLEADGSGDTVTFQLQVYENLKVGAVRVFAQFVYDDVEQAGAGGGASATIGHQGSSFLWSFNTPGAVSNGTVLSVISTCDGDVNSDGVVDPFDSGYVLARLGCQVGTGDLECDAADANGDGLVSPLDDGYVKARFGEPQKGACCLEFQCFEELLEEECLELGGDFTECLPCEELYCHPTSPGASCCMVHEEGGCNDPQLEDCVCGFFPFCCNLSWSMLCVDAIDIFDCGDCSNLPDEDCGNAEDCNGNGQPDGCDIVNGVSQDCDLDGVPDECQSAEVVEEEHFDAIPSEWTFLDDAEFSLEDGTARLVASGQTFGAGAAFFNNGLGTDAFEVKFKFILTQVAGGVLDGSGDPDPDGLAFIVTSGSPAGAGFNGYGLGYKGFPTDSFAVEFDTFHNFINGQPDDPDGNHVGIDLGGSVESITTAYVVPDFDETGQWHVRVRFLFGEITVWVTPPGGGEMEIITETIPVPNIPPVKYFGFGAGTGANSADTDVDDVTITLLDNDCNANGVPDLCDISDGTSLDVNGNIVPDECEPAECC